MKNSTLIKIVAYTCAAILAIFACFPVYAGAEEAGEFYPKLAVVFDFEMVGNDRVVYCVDKTRNVWSFYDDAGEWEKGDIANLLMWNIGKDPEYDEVVEVYWEGYTENIEMFFEINGWG